MTIFNSRNNGPSLAVNSVLLVCSAFLATEPIVWLVRTWFDGSWGSHGEYAFGTVVALFAWSATSRRLESRSPSVIPALLLALTAVVRVAGHILAVNVIGALALVVDVFALALLFRLHQRERSVSPFWLAVLFALSLPMERIAQRVVGFGLQQISAAGACGALSLGFGDVQCHGVDIVLAGQHVLVDLPCSGARGLLLMWAAFVGLAALRRPSIRWALVGAVVTVMAALVSNTVRIVVLALGIAHPETVGVDVMAQPWHDVIGLGTLALGLLPIVFWGRRETLGSDRGLPARSTLGPAGGPRSEELTARVAIAAALLAASVAVTLAPHRPVDVSRPIEELRVPATLNGLTARSMPLTDQERDYFTAFGGAAAKSRYGERTLLLVRTSAPLRHLHAPDECLVGAGFEVDRLGITHGVMPGATYRAVAPDGTVWRVVVTYQSDAGHLASSVSEAVWTWLLNPETTWTAIERVSRWDAPIGANERFDHALVRMLDDSLEENP